MGFVHHLYGVCYTLTVLYPAYKAKMIFSFDPVGM